jgi:signal transduction histidine kinase
MESIWSFEEAEGRLTELGVLSRMASLIRTDREAKDVVAEVISIVGDIVSCDVPAVFLYAEETDSLVFEDPMRDRSLTIPLAEPSMLRRIFHTGLGEVVNDVVSDPDVSPAMAESVGARQVVAVPLNVGDHRLGVLCGINSKVGAFTDDDLRRLSILADRAALTLQNADLRNALRRQRQELEGLQRLSKLLASAETVDHAVGESVRIVCDLLDCSQMAVLLYDEERDALVGHPPVVGMDEHTINSLAVSLADPSLIATVHRTGTPLVSNDAENDRWVEPALRIELGIQSLLVAPLSTGPHPIGVLLAINSKKGSFEDGDVRFTNLLGSRIAAVIESSTARERERALMQRLWEADRTKTEFVSMLAHELRGPMTTILGFSQTLSTQWHSVPDDKREHFLNIITKETGRLSRLVADLLDVSRMEAGSLHYELVPMPLDDLIGTVLDVHTSLQRHHDIITDVEDNLPKVMADRDRTRQVLINLLTNAVRYSPEATTIRVSARRSADGRQVVVSVADQGIGIAPQDMDKVFSKFVMLPKPTWVKKGTGLGLYITKGIVDAHGGRIWIDSEPGKGATFNFTLNIAQDAA